MYEVLTCEPQEYIVEDHNEPYVQTKGRRAMYMVERRGHVVTVDEAFNDFVPAMFEIAAFPMWDTTPEYSVNPRAGSCAMDAINEEKFACALMVAEAFTRKFGRQPSEVLIPRRKIAVLRPEFPVQLPPGKSGLLYVHDVAIVALG